MDFHQIFSIALPERIKSFSAFNSYLPTTIAIARLSSFLVSGVLKVLTSTKLKHVHQFSSNCFLIIPSNWAGVPACISWLFLLYFLEAFVVCQNYSPPAGYVPNMSNPLLDQHYGQYFINYTVKCHCGVILWLTFKTYAL